MRTFCFLITIYSIVILFSCSKGKDPDCTYLHTAGVINTISGPDSVHVGEQNQLTLDVTAPGLCVADIKVTVSRYTDTLYYVDADVQYSEGGSNTCNCTVKDHHYVRVFFTSPIAGTVSLTTTPGFGPSAGHTIKVF